MSLPVQSRAPRERSPKGLKAIPGALAYRVFRQALSFLRFGRLTVELPSGQHMDQTAAQAGPHGILKLQRWRALRRLALGGEVGFARAYLDGDWSSPDLAALIELVARNDAAFAGVIDGSKVVRFFNRLRHRARANTKAGSKRNILFHYDLGNAFYRQWLDKNMIYSSAIYPADTASLEDAQQAKIDRILRLLDVSDGDSVLEIGCGWGALAREMAEREKARVTGITLSPAQLEVARDRISRHGLEERVDLQLRDYRDVEGRFDRIVSIEMIEAVGEEFLPSYFGTIRRLLTEKGKAVLQAITIAEERFDSYRRTPDFIQRHIFPGGFLPTKTLLREQVARAGLTLVGIETFGESYALTLREWRSRFLEAWPRIRELGFDNRFRNLWEYYLSYCEGGFRAGSIDVGLYTLAPAPA